MNATTYRTEAAALRREAKLCALAADLLNEQADALFNAASQLDLADDARERRAGLTLPSPPGGSGDDAPTDAIPAIPANTEGEGVCTPVCAVGDKLPPRSSAPAPAPAEASEPTTTAIPSESADDSGAAPAVGVSPGDDEGSRPSELGDSLAPAAPPAGEEAPAASPASAPDDAGTRSAEGVEVGLSDEAQVLADSLDQHDGVLVAELEDLADLFGRNETRGIVSVLGARCAEIGASYERTGPGEYTIRRAP